MLKMTRLENWGSRELEEGVINEPDTLIHPGSGKKRKERRICYSREQLLARNSGIISAELLIDMAKSIPHYLLKDPNPNSSSFNLINPQCVQMRNGFGLPMNLRRMGDAYNQRDGRMMNMPHSRPSFCWKPIGQIGSRAPLQRPPFYAPKPNPLKAAFELHMHSKNGELQKPENNTWKSSTVARAKANVQGLGAEQKDNNQLIIDELVKNARAILDKLTPENFDQLVQEIVNLRLEGNDEKIGEVAHVVLEKALTEPHLVAACIRMVKALCERSQETAKKFSWQILNQCQKEIQKRITDHIEIKKLENDLVAASDDKHEYIKLLMEDKRMASQRRALRMVILSCELYKFQMVIPMIIVECANLLLTIENDESYGYLCKLLITVGKKLEDHLKDIELRVAENLKRGIAPQLQLFQLEANYMEKLFAKLKVLSQNNQISSQVRSALLDVYELRANNWKPRGKATAPAQINMQQKKGDDDRITVQTNKSSGFQHHAGKNGIITKAIPAFHDQDNEDLPLELSDDESGIVKNILDELIRCRKWEDTLELIQSGFRGKRLCSFIDEFSRLVGELPKEEQKTARILISILTKIPISQ